MDMSILDLITDFGGGIELIQAQLCVVELMEIEILLTTGWCLMKVGILEHQLIHVRAHLVSN